MAHPIFKFVNMADTPPPSIDRERWQPIADRLNAIDAESTTGYFTPEHQKRKWQFVESLTDEDLYRFGCWWVQNQ